MRVAIWMGPRVVQRAELLSPSTLIAAGFSMTEAVSEANSPGLLEQQINFDAGDVVTILAIESEGGGSGPVDRDDDPRLEIVNNLVEFAGFEGDGEGTGENGVEAITTGGTKNVTVKFSRMRAITLSTQGFGFVNGTFVQTPNILVAGERPPSGVQPFRLPFGSAPNARRFLRFQFKTGTQLQYRIEPAVPIIFPAPPQPDPAFSSDFVRWLGACSINSMESCTLTFGAQDLVTTVVNQYFQCGVSVSGSGNPLLPGSCQEITPSAPGALRRAGRASGEVGEDPAIGAASR